MDQSRIMRSESDKMIAGVCGGLGAYLNIDPMVIRFAFIALTIAGGMGIAIYIVLAAITPSSADVTFEKSPDLDNLWDDEAHVQRQKNNTMLFAGGLIVIGVWLLFANLGIAKFVMPLVLIAAGAYLVQRERTK